MEKEKRKKKKEKRKTFFAQIAMPTRLTEAFKVIHKVQASSPIETGKWFTIINVDLTLITFESWHALARIFID